MKQFIITLNEDCGTFHISTQNMGFSRFEKIGILDAVLAKERAEMNEDMAPNKTSTGPMPDDVMSRLFKATRIKSAYQSEIKKLKKIGKKPLSKTNKYLRDPKMRKKMIAASVRTSSKIDS